MEKRREFDIHHWLPRSRFHTIRGVYWNRRVVNKARHILVHSLFGNMTICEMALALLQEFGPIDRTHLSHDPALEALIEHLKGVRK